MFHTEVCSLCASTQRLRRVFHAVQGRKLDTNPTYALRVLPDHALWFCLNAQKCSIDILTEPKRGNAVFAEM